MTGTRTTATRYKHRILVGVTCIKFFGGGQHWDVSVTADSRQTRTCMHMGALVAWPAVEHWWHWHHSSVRIHVTLIYNNPAP